MWRKRIVVAATASLTVTSIVLGAALPIAAAIQQTVKCPKETRAEPADAGDGLDCHWHIWVFKQVRYSVLR